ncbi:heavy-metal-associated domain-containing protein [Arthrobacter roseus]|uniref:heavy-metal-associated domain-containing protein n=1 Tax=Arthrobacter roseus TaxID=136274 RepID=UPI001963F86A|nr:heavy-metal-associated domain-containing protein [Arthrobacter roseus]MBM7849493.1 copper chaperone CopZ [Arthrobacter roseus]
MQTATFRTEPFTCPSCVKKIENTLPKKDGVASAEVKFNASKVNVEFDENKTTASTIADLITGLGYPVLSTKIS